MNAREMLEKVQDLKEQVAMGMAYGGTEEGQASVAAAKEFLCENYMQVLDILDDALYAYLNGGDDRK